jgi:uncharacterized repeat protein (TIGR03803 family)
MGTEKLTCFGRLRGWRSTLALFLLCAVTAIACPAQTVTTLASFDESTTGVNPVPVALVQGLDGNFYGTASGGGANFTSGGGTVFKITPSGALTALYSFCSQTNCTDGSDPVAGLIQAVDGNLYGTATGGGANERGTVFKITPSGTLTTIYSFCAQTDCADGSIPFAGLVQAADGNFYGTTEVGGRGSSPSCGNSAGCGTVFKLTPSGTLTTLYSFCAQSSCADGSLPLAGLVQATDGSLYGTTSQGGAYGNGEVFEVIRSGITILQSFDFNGNPYAGLVQDRDGSLYGTTNGCSDGVCNGDGTVYKVTLRGQLVADRFNGANGAAPSAGLVQGTDGNFYGTTTAGGSDNLCNGRKGCGTLFKLGPTHVLTALYSFCVQSGCPDGSVPAGGLVQGTDGNFYGTTAGGGANGNGTVFSLSVGLGPFVKTLPASGKVGGTVIILGTNLTGASSVSFNGTAATFTVVSSSEITTSIPTGATSGTVQVTTPNGVLLSNVAFQVTP